MMVELGLALAASLIVSSTLLLQRYLRRLPQAPQCPGCRALTQACDDLVLLAALMPALGGTVLRECTRCGWRGRMRLRLATHGAGRG